MSNFSRDLPFNQLPDLPPAADLELPAIFKATIRANRALAELKGSCQRLPQPEMLLNTLVLQESKESSAIENIVTTQDELYRATLQGNAIKNQAAKEVLQYRNALYWGIDELNKTELITTNLLVGIMQRLRLTQDGIRKNPGTRLGNPSSGQIIYTPPEGEELLRTKLAALERFMNDGNLSDLDPLVKMALIHYQFEAIHPFSDGNGRTGRILNILYLIQQGLLGLPVLYLSRYIIQHKGDYYRLLREVTEEGNWKDWVLFVTNGVAETAINTLQKIEKILSLKAEMEDKARKEVRIANLKEIMDLLFSYPYIKIGVLEEKGIAGRQTAAKYLKALESKGFLSPVKVWKETYYINEALVQVLSS